MQMQPFEVVANALAVLALVVLTAVHLYGRRRFEPPENEGAQAGRHRTS